MKWLIDKAFLTPSVEQLLSRQIDSWTSKIIFWEKTYHYDQSKCIQAFLKIGTVPETVTCKISNISFLFQKQMALVVLIISALQKHLLFYAKKEHNNIIMRCFIKINLAFLFAKLNRTSKAHITLNNS